MHSPQELVGGLVILVEGVVVDRCCRRCDCTCGRRRSFSFSFCLLLQLLLLLLPSARPPPHLRRPRLLSSYSFFSSKSIRKGSLGLGSGQALDGATERVLGARRCGRGLLLLFSSCEGVFFFWSGLSLFVFFASSKKQSIPFLSLSPPLFFLTHLVLRAAALARRHSDEPPQPLCEETSTRETIEGENATSCDRDSGDDDEGIVDSAF